MIKKFIDKLLGKSTPGTRRQAAKVSASAKKWRGPASVHGIDPKLVDERAANVVRTLKQAGFEAYIVGGAVRDLLLGLRPKDFRRGHQCHARAGQGPVPARLHHRAALSHRARGVWPRARARGDRGLDLPRLHGQRRGRAGGRQRKTSKGELAGMKHAVDASGRVLRDNVWGPQDEDATRRDFTINAMYYDPATQIVVDYHGGIKDAKKHLLRMIGDPATRYREDPVRIIRAVRFAAKLSPLGFTLDPRPRAPGAVAGPAGRRAAKPLFDEMLKLLQTGHALATIEQLKKLGLARGIYPLLDVVVERADQPFVNAALQDTDRRVGEGKPVAPSFLLACVLWEDVRDGWAERQNQRQHPFPALQDAIDEVFNASALATSRAAASWPPTCARSG
jgi:poly(A) polymerase